MFGNGGDDKAKEPEAAPAAGTATYSADTSHAMV
jgi:hypothetical protein